MKEGATRALGIALFVVMGASALVLGVMNTGQGISKPLALDLLSGNAPADSQKTVELKSKDTDGDGLNDYDELNAYQTSPYIKDTDSDGVDDGAEVREGTDPKCPKGQDCGTPAPIEPPASGNSPLDLLNVSPSDLYDSATGSDTVLPPADGTSSNILQATKENVSQIRQMLKQQGIADDLLNAIDDVTLIQMYNDSIVEAQEKANANANN
jgi:hypothetical protein